MTAEEYLNTSTNLDECEVRNCHLLKLIAREWKRGSGGRRQNDKNKAVCISKTIGHPRQVNRADLSLDYLAHWHAVLPPR